MRKFVRVWILLILCLCLTIPSSYKSSDSFIFPNYPPLPSFHGEQVQTVIVSTDDGMKDDVLHEVLKLPSVSVGTEYNTVFKGFSLTGTRGELEKITKISGVKDVYPNHQYKATIEHSVPYIGAENIRSYLDVHNHRLTGEGIKVGVIDTGVDYSHPDLRRNFKGGFDLVDGDRDPMETKVKQGIPTMHGTHVAGIIAANGKIQGVAPKAEIIAYRALGPGGMGSSEQVIAAIEKAIEDKVDIINLSLGNEVNGPDWPTSIALNKAVEKGIVAVTSSGNSGPNMWTVGSPGTASKGISVGASTPPMKIPYITMGKKGKEIALTPMQGGKAWGFTRDTELVNMGLGFRTDYKQNVEGKVVLLERGTIPFSEKAANAIENGAIGVIIYNNVSGGFAGSLEFVASIPVVSISKEDGKYLKDALNETSYFKTKYKEIKDSMASFSSRGPVTYTWEIKPDVVAPGVNINSTIPDGYEALQGTSMAAPHVAGAAALIKQSHPNWSPVQIKAALMNTAKKLSVDNHYYDPIEQGAGRIQIEQAVLTKTLIYPSSLTFGMFHNEDTRTEREVTITIDNQSDEMNTYTFDVPKSKNGIQWKLPTSVQVPPKQKREVQINVDLTPAVLKKGVHSNWLTIREKSNKIELPYLFVVEEPNYPRLMGFQFDKGDTPNTFVYEAYLPGGAEEFGIALYDPDTFRFIKYLDFAKDVPRGLVKKELTKSEIGLTGVYKGLVFAKNKGKEDTIEVLISIPNSRDDEKISTFKERIQ